MTLTNKDDNCTLNNLGLEDNELLVIGASGHSSRYFFERLQEEKYTKKIKCLVRIDSEISHLKKLDLNLNFIYSDLDDINFLKETFRGVKTVLHVAGILFSEEIIRLGILADVRWFVCVHTTGRYSNFKSASQEYIRIEDSLLKKHPNLTILRPTMIYGSSSDQNLWKLINYMDKYNFFPVFGRGRNLMQPVNAKDLGDAYFDVLKHKKNTFGKQYNLSGKDEISYISLLREVSFALRKKVFFIYIPIWICLLGAYILNFLLKSRFPISVEQVLRMKEDKIFSFEDANKDFGYSPMGFRDGIRSEVNELKKKAAY